MSNKTQTRETYHHGDLPDTLIKEGARLLAESGVEGFSLRQVARRAGVTVAAPSHHFGSARGLLTAIATEGFTRLARQMEATAASDCNPEEVIILMCKAYVEMGLTEPGYASVMFRLDLLDAEDERFRHRAFDAFELLKAAFRDAAPDKATEAQVSTATMALWATMHGIMVLPMIESENAEKIIRSTVCSHLAGMQ
ncbi:TetR/AcrR family transcriptional regulator [Oricola sp.]|uniref:TetR/AcrR family transcriptional regulator n=1 Tax=Oricola sp. TaxID=1979950 RepID=UPI003BACBDCA